MQFFRTKRRDGSGIGQHRPVRSSHKVCGKPGFDIRVHDDSRGVDTRLLEPVSHEIPEGICSDLADVTADFSEVDLYRMMVQTVPPKSLLARLGMHGVCGSL